MQSWVVLMRKGWENSKRTLQNFSILGKAKPSTHLENGIEEEDSGIEDLLLKMLKCKRGSLVGF